MRGAQRGALGTFVHAAILAKASIADPELAVSAVARLAAAMDAKAARVARRQCRDHIREGLEAVDVQAGERCVQVTCGVLRKHLGGRQARGG